MFMHGAVAERAQLIRRASLRMVHAAKMGHPGGDLSAADILATLYFRILAVNPANIASLRRHALLVCLWATPETIYARVRHQTHRPLLQTPDPLARIRDLLADRTPAYRQADLIVGVDFRSPLETAKHIAAAFQPSTAPKPEPAR